LLLSRSFYHCVGNTEKLGQGLLGGIKVASRTFTAILHKEGDLYVALCPEAGTASQGYTIEEAVANLKEATELYLEDFPLPGTERPIFTTFEADNVA